MVSMLDRKLFRDLLGMRGQASTIALVVACGIAGYVTMQSTSYSLERVRDRFYESTRFPDVFVHLKRAPESVSADLATIPGVARVETRISDAILLPLEDMPDPAVGRLVSLPTTGTPALSAIALRAGRMPEHGRSDEAVVVSAFADAHRLGVGSTVPAVLNGVRRDIRIVGLAMSPEYVFATQGEGIADIRRLGVLWMDRDAIAPAFQLDGAFDDVVVGLEPGASEAGVMDALDKKLAPYGGLGAIPKRRQASNFMLEGEFSQLRSMATVVPMIFLAVAAFLLNVVLGRVVNLQRGQIATLKALGYRNLEVGLHYGKLITLITFIGAVLGIALGAWLGRGMFHMYEPFYVMPDMRYELDWRITGAAVLVSFASAFVGGFMTLRRVVRLPPAEAMQPEPPPTYRPTFIERLGVTRLLGGLGRMVLRELTRRPLRTSLSVIGLSLAMMGLVTARFGYDGVDTFTFLLFETQQRDDLAVSVRTPVRDGVEHEVANLPGVLATEPMRMVPVRIRSGHRFRDVALIGHPSGASLRRIYEWPPREIAVPPEGLVLTTKLGEVLGIRLGDDVELEVLEGDRRTVHAPVVAFANEMFGLQVHASLDTLHRLEREQEGISTIAVRVDPIQEEALERRLRDMPNVASVSRLKTIRDNYLQTAGESMFTTALILTLFSITIVVGVVYNDARITLSLRARDLASLRVLGFTRSEIATVLLGELGTNVMLSVIPGLVLGWLVLVYGLPAFIEQQAPELIRYPGVANPRTFAISLVVLMGAALGTALLVRRSLDKLDLIGVLKTRE
jgi:putative ABC transport system permease protein